MSEVMIRDVVLWTKHISGDRELSEHLFRLKAEREIELVVDGVRGHWRKMSDGRDGRPTAGLTPQGRMQTFWRELYATRKGETVSLALAGAQAGAVEPGSWGALIERSRSAVAAAQAALLTPRGWSSEGRTVSRDELHE